MTKESYTSFFLKCGHCGNLAPMLEAAKYYRSTKPDYDPNIPEFEQDPIPDEGWQYDLLLCLACKKVTLREYFYCEVFDDEDIEIKTIYPPREIEIYRLPSPVREAYEAAIKAKNIDADAYALLSGRLLEAVCKDRKAAGKNLYAKLEDLSKQGEIPEKLVDVAHGIRDLRNVGAHEPFEGLSKEEIPLLDKLIKAILEYIYIAPALAEEATERLERIKRRNKSYKNQM